MSCGRTHGGRRPTVCDQDSAGEDFAQHELDHRQDDAHQAAHDGHAEQEVILEDRTGPVFSPIQPLRGYSTLSTHNPIWSEGQTTQVHKEATSDSHSSISQSKSSCHSRQHGSRRPHLMKRPCKCAYEHAFWGSKYTHRSYKFACDEWKVSL